MPGSKKKPRAAKPSILVLCEGRTEQWYIQQLIREEAVRNLRIEPKLPVKPNLKKQYDQVREGAAIYDMVVWIIDLDVFLTAAGKGEQLDKLRNIISGLRRYKNVELIVNNSCFEFWLLLHFEKTDRKFQNYGEVIKQLKRYLPDYEKSEKYYKNISSGLYTKMKEHTAIAIGNARALGLFDIDEPEAAKSKMFKFLDLLNAEVVKKL